MGVNNTSWSFGEKKKLQLQNRKKQKLARTHKEQTHIAGIEDDDLGPVEVSRLGSLKLAFSVAEEEEEMQQRKATEPTPNRGNPAQTDEKA